MIKVKDKMKNKLNIKLSNRLKKKQTDSKNFVSDKFISSRADSKIVKYYDGISSGYDELHYDEQKKKLDVIKTELNSTMRKNHRLLDVGCGTCFSKNFFNCIYFGIEPSLEMLKKSDYYLKQKKDLGGENLFVGGAEDLDSFFEKKFFDYIICVSVAHHFRDWEASLKNIIVVAKPGAIFVFSLLRTKNVLNQEQKLENFFDIYKRVDDFSLKDVILFCKNKNFK